MLSNRRSNRAKHEKHLHIGPCSDNARQDMPLRGIPFLS